LSERANSRARGATRERKARRRTHVFARERENPRVAGERAGCIEAMRHARVCRGGEQLHPGALGLARHARVYKCRSSSAQILATWTGREHRRPSACGCRRGNWRAVHGKTVRLCTPQPHRPAATAHTAHTAHAAQPAKWPSSHLRVQSDGYMKSTPNLDFWPPFFPSNDPVLVAFSAEVTTPLDVTGRNALADLVVAMARGYACYVRNLFFLLVPKNHQLALFRGLTSSPVLRSSWLLPWWPRGCRSRGRERCGAWLRRRSMWARPLVCDVQLSSSGLCGAR
jgi:hypothetical protein